MDIIIKGRHTTVHEQFRRHVTGKLAKIEKLDHRVIRVDVEVSKERNPRLADRRERVELTIRSRGPAIRAEASADDRYAAFDAAMDKLENQLRKLCDRRKIHRGTHTPPSAGVVAATLAEQNGNLLTHPTEQDTEESEASTEPADALVPGPRTAAEPGEPDEPTIPIETEGEGPLLVREKYHQAQPMAIEQALFEMELVGHDFYLFRDRDSGYPSVVYRRRGYDYGVLRLVED